MKSNIKKIPTKEKNFPEFPVLMESLEIPGMVIMAYGESSSGEMFNGIVVSTPGPDDEGNDYLGEDSGNWPRKKFIKFDDEIVLSN